MWQSGFWSESFWQDGFWLETEQQQGNEPSGGALLRSSQAQTKRVIDAVARESKAKQKRLEEERKKALEQAPEALEAPASISDAEARLARQDATHEGYSPLHGKVVPVDLPVAHADDLLRNISYATDKNLSVAATTDNSLAVFNDALVIGNDDDEALALIMILAEMD